LVGQEIHWRFEELEPDQSNDFAVALVMPSAWQNVLKERAVLDANPNDGEAWGRLGKLYKEMFFFRRGFRQDAGGQDVYRMSLEAYEKAVTLLPEDALWHAGYADLLAVHSYYAIQEGQDARSEMLRSMQEIQLAQELSPNEPKVREIAEKIYFLFPDAIEQLESGYDYLWLTATPPASTPTFVPSESAVIPTGTASPPSTATVVPAEKATPAPASESAARPLCASALLAPLGMFWLARRKKSLRS
jgi:tetratricopeptide (TPR) repeat protein